MTDHDHAGPASRQSYRGLVGIADDIAKHRASLGNGRAECYQRALEHLAVLLTPDGPGSDPALVAKLARCWNERAFHAFYERPLLLLAAIRHDVLLEGSAHPLALGFASERPDAAAVTRDRVRAALAPSRFGLWITLTTRKVQTNETSRAVTWMWPAHLAGADRGARPLTLIDVGASAGLNLVGDMLPPMWSRDRGARLDVVTAPTFDRRIGFDTDPLDVLSEADVTWMRACIWPGESARLERFERAVETMREVAGRPGAPELLRLNAGLVPVRLEALARAMPPSGLLIVYQTLVRGYIDPEREQHYARNMRSFLAARPKATAAWIELELTDNDPRGSEPAAMTAHVHGGGGVIVSLPLARCGYHPTTLAVDAAAASELTRLLKT